MQREVSSWRLKAETRALDAAELRQANGAIHWYATLRKIHRAGGR